MSISHRLALPVLGALVLGLGCEQTPPKPPFTAAQHALLFPIDTGDTHQLGKRVESSSRTDSITCEGCHGRGEEFAAYNCLNCHGETSTTQIAAAHALVPLFDADTEACYQCHRDGKRGVHIEPPPPPGHDAGPEPEVPSHAFPYTAGTAHSPDDDPNNADDYMDRANAQGKSHCGACHASTANLMETLCADCHSDDEPAPETLHTGRLRAAYDTIADCKLCHWTTPLPSSLSMEAHDAVSCTDHYGSQCFTCHNQETLQGSPYEWAIDFAMPAAPVACAPCHAGDAREYPAPCN